MRGEPRTLTRVMEWYTLTTDKHSSENTRGKAYQAMLRELAAYRTRRDGRTTHA